MMCFEIILTFNKYASTIKPCRVSTFTGQRVSFLLRRTVGICLAGAC